MQAAGGAMPLHLLQAPYRIKQSATDWARSFHWLRSVLRFT
jgi:hypothetical protein